MFTAESFAHKNLSNPLKRHEKILSFTYLSNNQFFDFRSDLAQGIIFRQDDWQNVLMQAKAYKKLIFVEIYTIWCDACKEMDKKTFAEPAVNEKFNVKFIN